MRVFCDTGVCIHMYARRPRSTIDHTARSMTITTDTFSSLTYKVVRMRAMQY